MYVDLVLCKHNKIDKKSYLFVAPFASLSVGDKVIVDTACGETLATVTAITNVEEASDDYNFIVQAAGAYQPLRKVLYKAKELTYKEEVNNERVN